MSIYNTPSEGPQTTFSSNSAFAKTSYELFDQLSMQYSSLSFFQKDTFVSCLSTQIGCPEKCAFCATGDKKYIKNLNKEEMLQQYRKSFELYPSLSQGIETSKYVIVLEGMGEASFNLQNALDALLEFYNEIESSFEGIKFSISTSGRLVSYRNDYRKFIEEHGHEMPKLNFDLQFSLHSAIQQERASMIPNIHKKYSLDELLYGSEENIGLYDMSEFLGEKLKINYMLINYPNGNNNYSISHIQALENNLLSEKTKIKLTRYSETYKGYSSPTKDVYDDFKNTLELAGFEVEIVDVQGTDINGGCGMIDYKSKNEFIYDEKVAKDYTNFWNDSNKTQSLGYNYILNNIGNISGKNILDYGCGTGEFTKIMDDCGGNIVGVDISPNMLQIAKNNNPSSKYQLVGDILEDSNFDIITINYVLCVIENKEKIKKILSGLAGNLVTGGKIYIQNANRDEANGMEFDSFSLIKNNNLKNGNEMFAVLKGVSGGKDLVVKDHFHSIDVYKEILSELGFEVIVNKFYEGENPVAPVYVIEANKLDTSY